MNYRRIIRALIARIRSMEQCQQMRENRIGREAHQRALYAAHEQEQAEREQYHADQRARAMSDLEEAERRGDDYGARQARDQLARHI